METMHVKMVFESYAIRNTEGKEIFRSASPTEAYGRYNAIVHFNDYYGVDPKLQPVATERALAECEVVSFSHVINCKSMTLYRIYINGEPIKEIMFRPYPLDVIRAVAPGLDWKKIND